MVVGSRPQRVIVFMSIAQAERLKAELTDKYVVVSEGVPELRRFAGLTGTVKTVNMSCRALVQFDGPVDIGWYDIDPAYLKVVTAPQPKKAEAKHEAKSEAAPAVAKPAVAKPAGTSPLDAIRAAGAAKPAAAAATPAAGGAKPSPLDMIRKQAAAKAGGEAAPAAAPVAEKPAPAKLSPMEMIRQQAAAKAAGTAPAAAAPAPVAAASAPVAPVAAAPEVKPPVVPAAPAPTAAGRPKSTAEVLAAIRKQGGGK